jgi:hypothetical protein
MFEMKREAIIDETGRYRYALLRLWEPGKGYVVFIMLNPSTADGYEDDPTIRKCVQFARDWGYGGLIVVNMFALRSTNPDALLTEPDPVGSKNNYWTALAITQADAVICAWGSHKAVKKHPERRAKVLDLVRLLGHEPKCLKLSNGGEPYHPLYLRSDTVPFPLVAA